LQPLSGAAAAGIPSAALLAERFRAATDPQDVQRLGDRMGRMLFGG